jgi:hypothetical protein
MSCIGRNTENDFSLLRLKIRELPSVHRETLGALLRHLSHVASHSDNAEIKRLADVFSYVILRVGDLTEHDLRLKARCIDLFKFSS